MIQVFIKSYDKNKNKNYKNTDIIPRSMMSSETQIPYTKMENLNFIIDSAATLHIIYKREYFSLFQECNKVVNWGNVGSIKIKRMWKCLYIIQNQLK